MKVDSLVEQFEYLDALRASGVTNMYGAGAYLEEEFELSKSDARQVLGKWMQTFDQNKSVEDRAAEAMAHK